MNYLFRDADELGNEIPFRKDKFAKLLNICFKYSEKFSLLFYRKKVNLQNALDNYLLMMLKVQHIDGSNDYNDGYVKFYKCCDETKTALMKVSDNLYGFIDGWGLENPGNLTFYREDGSIFFLSIVHEGEYYFQLNEAEESNSEIAELLKMTKSIKTNCKFESYFLTDCYLSD